MSLEINGGNIQDNRPQIYAEYVQDCSYIDTLVIQIEQLEQSYPKYTAELQGLISQLNTLKAGTLTKDYQTDYQNNDLATFESQWQGIKATADGVLSQAEAIVSGGDIQYQIQQDYANAQTLVQGMTNEINQDQISLHNMQSQLASLLAQINALPDGDQKTKAQAAYNTLAGDITSAQTQLIGLQNSLSGLSGTLSQLQTLAGLPNPTQDDLTKATGLLAIVQGVKSAAAQFDNTAMANVNNDLTALNNILNPPPPYTVVGETCYIDLGTMWGGITAGGEAYIQQLVAQLKAAGITNIEFSFAQVGDIDSLANGGQGASSDDILGEFLASEPQLFNELIAGIHSAGMTAGISLGGEAAQNDQILKPGETAAGQAQKLFDFMQKYGFDNADFDIEDNAFLNGKNAPADAQAFFQSLHEKLSSVNKTMSLTVMGSTSWATSSLRAFFYDAQGNSIFTTMFDGLNLMLYSDSQYYIDTNTNEGWGVDDWLKIIGIQNASKLHIGFDDGIQYQDPSSSGNPDGGERTGVTPNMDPGTAAAVIYENLLSDLRKEFNNPNLTLGSPFWWPAETGDMGSRYSWNGGSLNFGTGSMSNFFNKLEQDNNPLRG